MPASSALRRRIRDTWMEARDQREDQRVIRQVFPKRCDLTRLHPRELEQVVGMFNNRQEMSKLSNAVGS